jgi:hypothetical protein
MDTTFKTTKEMETDVFFELQSFYFVNISLENSVWGMRNVIWGLESLKTLALEKICFRINQELDIVFKSMNIELKDLLITGIRVKGLVLNLKSFTNLNTVDLSKNSAYIDVQVNKSQSFVLVSKKKYKISHTKVGYYF